MDVNIMYVGWMKKESINKAGFIDKKMKTYKDIQEIINQIYRIVSYNLTVADI
jgi:hypothetical protein